MDPYTIFGPLDSLLATPSPSDTDPITYVVFVVVLLNLLTRFLSYRSNAKEARSSEDGSAEGLTRYLPHDVMNGVLLLTVFYYLTWHHHGGIVLSALSLGMVITDLFEFEARKVQARKDEALSPPKAAIAASTLVLAYAFYESLFFIIKPIWSSII